MANDPSDDRGPELRMTPEPLATASNFPQRHVLSVGIAVACLLGAGAGLWARPAAEDQRPAAPAAKYVAKPVPQALEIVIDDGPAPIGKPIEVLPAGVVPARVAVAAPRAPDLAPLGPPAALLKAQAVDAAAIEPDPEPVAAPEPAKVEAPPPKPRVEKVRPEKVRPETAKAEKVKAEKVVAERKPAAKPRKAEVRKPAAKPKAETKVAKAEPPAKAPSRVSKVRKVLAKVAPAREKKVAKAEPPKSRPKAKAPERETRLAKAEKPAPKTVKVAKAANRCVSADPGAALVCADPALGAADRRLTRAYREAEAAGVPTWQLRQQQQRWLAARAAAAREAPWAVHDVYLARIAELQDMTRDVRDGY